MVMVNMLTTRECVTGSGLGMSHMHSSGLDLFKTIVAMDQDNYPDTLKV